MDKENLALFLGMLSGDGYLGIRTKKAGYKSFSVEFCNTNLELVKLFDELLYKLFNVKGNFYSRVRENRKRIYDFRTYSKLIFNYISFLGFPIGIKRDSLKVLPIIWDGTIKEKVLFIKGFLITDGHIKKSGAILFHSGSKLFLEDLSQLIYELIGVKREIKEYLQKGKFYSYQLNLNKGESQKILSMPPSHNGIASVLSF